MVLRTRRRIEVVQGDCLDLLQKLEDDSIGSVIQDPPYAINFMNKSWDTGEVVFSPVLWENLYRVLRPGGIMKSFCATKTYHRMAQAIVRAGFPEPDLKAWTYANSFPHSLNVSKAIDKHLKVERGVQRMPFLYKNGFMRSGGANPRPWQDKAAALGYHEMPSDEPASEAAHLWLGWGTCLKPAWEAILVTRKPS